MTRGSTPDAREVVVPLTCGAAPPPPVTRVRSTLITASLAALETRGLSGDYFQRLDPSFATTIKNTIAGVWVPVEVALAHYRACDALPLTAADQIEIGRHVGQKIQTTLLGMLLGLAKQGGASPWLYLAQAGRLQERLLIGGACAVYRVAEKEGVMELFGIPLFEFSYFRNGWRGLNQTMCELFCTRAYVKAVAHANVGVKTVYAYSWV